MCYGTHQHIQKLVDDGLIEICLEILDSFQDAKFLLLALETLQSTLKDANNSVSQSNHGNQYLFILEKAGGVRIFDRLQNHPDIEVYNKVYRIIDEFFDT